MNIDNIKMSSEYILNSLNTYKLEDISDGMLKSYLMHATGISNELAKELNIRHLKPKK
jgi:hypothetical protein